MSDKQYNHFTTLINNLLELIKLRQADSDNLRKRIKKLEKEIEMLKKAIF